MTVLRSVIGLHGALVLLCASLSAAEVSPWHAARTLFQERCIKCHGGAEQKGGLDLRSEASVFTGGDSGPAIEKGDPSTSLLLEMVAPDAETRMPPKKGPALTDEQVSVLNRWVTATASPNTSDQTDRRLLPSGLSPELVIDFALERAWHHLDHQRSALISDEHFVRRATLDLLGRIPTLSERQAFLTSTSSAKRRNLVDALLESPEHARHLAEIFDVVLLGRSERLPGTDRPLERDETWHQYLRWAFSTNRPWNQMVRDLIEARPDSDPEKGASWYLYAHKNDHQAIATSIAPNLLGKQIACAQCHDHPIIPEIEQGHFWAMVAFFNRSYNVQTPQGPRVGEHAVGGHLQYSNLKSESFDAKLTFLTGEIVEEESPSESHVEALYRVPPPASTFETVEQPEKDAKSTKRGEKMPRYDAAPIPHFSRREQLAKVAIERNPDFAKAFVNRVWALLLGRGFVHPIDHIDSIHPPSHPELFDWLAKDFSTNGYDVRRLIRSIMASKVYQLESIPASAQRPPEDSFACGLIKPLTAEALYRSMLVALGHTPDPGGQFHDVDENALRSLLVRAYPHIFSETFNPRTAEALLYSNNPTLDALAEIGEGSLLEQFRGHESADQAVRHAFVAIHGRDPHPEELEACRTFIANRPERSKHLLWSLMASSEFRFNH